MSILLILLFIVIELSLIFRIIFKINIIWRQVINNSIIKNIDNVLPQNQCGQCGYPSCYPYAKAIKNSNENINKCLPGGNHVMHKIAKLLNIAPQEIDKNNLNQDKKRKVAFIDEKKCIGCTKCIKVCPVDAIIGTTHVLHTVIEDLCTGCTLCIAPCPTDSINLRSIKSCSKTMQYDLTNIPIKVILPYHTYNNK